MRDRHSARERKHRSNGISELALCSTFSGDQGSWLRDNAVMPISSRDELRHGPAFQNAARVIFRTRRYGKVSTIAAGEPQRRHNIARADRATQQQQWLAKRSRSAK